jgi:hypothetical protein
MLQLVIGVLLLILLAATAARYTTFRSRINHSDVIGAFVFFIIIALPVLIVGLAMIARYVESG